MKKLLLAAVVALSALTALVTPASAQQPSPEQMKQMQKQARDKMVKDLGLKPDQVKKVDALQAKFAKLAMDKMSALRKKYGEKPTPEQQQMAMKEMMALQNEIGPKAQKEFLAILTPEQQKKAKAMMAAGGAGGGAPR
jgi:Spy/CpxP family protein refolding chaperone